MRSQLVSFGNYLLKTYSVSQHSTDGKNTPLLPKEVSHADIENWGGDTDIMVSRFKHGDKVIVSFADAGVIKNCQVDGVVFDIGKIRYNLTVKMEIDGQSFFTNLLEIDSAFVSADENTPARYKSEMRSK